MKLPILAKSSVVDSTQSLIRVNGNAWWAEIITTEPPCLYYFSPFQNPIEATFNCFGYIVDLLGERAEGIIVTVKRGNPEILTICHREAD